MKKRIEKNFGRVMRGVMFAVNPIKKKAMKTTCIVHKFINIQAIHILYNDGYIEAAEYYKKHIRPLNEGVTWADQDFRSSNHFFHHENEKGLYGFSNALDEAVKYNKFAKDYLKHKNINKGIFYVGAAAHLIQDTTVPQHVNNKLLKSHRKFELWVISKLLSDYDFSVDRGTLPTTSIQNLIRENAKIANSTYSKYNNIEDIEERFYEISRVSLKRAQVSTAAYLLDFYNNVIKKST